MAKRNVFFRGLFAGFIIFSSIACGAQNNNVNDTSEPTPTRPTPEAPGKSEILAEFEQWKNHYKLMEPFTKMTDNRGNGYEDLYGTRNFRVVLHGVYYRGGANNKFHRSRPRDNQNPLPNDGLKNLCEEGFGKAVYLYSTRYSTAPQKTTCSANLQLDYEQKSVLEGDNYRFVLDMIFQRIKGKINGPIYGHCWNGWHASGLAAAIALKQFCDWAPKEAEAYWRVNTDGNEKGYDHVVKKLNAFSKLPEYAITAEEKALFVLTRQNDRAELLSSTNFKGYAILIVDDEEQIRDTLKQYFEMMEATVETAGNGGEAITILKSKHVDAIISDVRMPEVDGRSLLKFVNTRGNEVKPFFFMTGFSDLTEKSAKELGATGLFNKPFNFYELEIAMGKALGLLK